MIRAEIVLKDKYGYAAQEIERSLKRYITKAVTDIAHEKDAEIVRVQFLGTKK